MQGTAENAGLLFKGSRPTLLRRLRRGGTGRADKPAGEITTAWLAQEADRRRARREMLRAPTAEWMDTSDADSSIVPMETDQHVL